MTAATRSSSSVSVMVVCGSGIVASCCGTELASPSVLRSSPVWSAAPPLSIRLAKWRRVLATLCALRHDVRVTPAERLARIEEARAEYDAHRIAAEHAHQQLIDEIRAGLEDAAALPRHRKRELGP